MLHTSCNQQSHLDEADEKKKIIILTLKMVEGKPKKSRQGGQVDRGTADEKQRFVCRRRRLRVDDRGKAHGD